MLFTLLSLYLLFWQTYSIHGSNALNFCPFSIFYSLKRLSKILFFLWVFEPFSFGGFINSTNTLFLSLYYILFITTRANRQSINTHQEHTEIIIFFHLQHTLCIFYKTEAPFLLAKEHKAYFLIQLKVSIHICSK